MKNRCSFLLALLIVFQMMPVINAESDIVIPEVSLNGSIEYQEIDGFGVSQSADVYADQIFYHNKKDELMDLLFSQTQGIGLSILRSEVGNGLNMPTIHPNEDSWNFDPYIPEQWVMKEARSRGVETFMSTVWSPPAWMKNNNRITRGGKLKREHYSTYADYLATYVAGYKKYHGITIDAISIANEPEYAAPWQSNRWSGDEFRDFVRDYLKPKFAEEKIDAKIIVGEEGTWTDKRLYPIYNDPQAMDAIDIVASHYYRGKPYRFENAQNNNKRVWLTETSETILSSTDFKDGVRWSRHIHDFLTKADVNAFMYWLGASYKTNNESLIRLIDENNYIDAKRLYSMGNFSKFIRPGFIRIDIAENPVGNLHLSAYMDKQSGEVVIVAVNDGQNNETIKLKFDDFSLNRLTPHITNEKYNLKEFPEMIANEDEYMLSISGYSTITYTGNINDEKVSITDKYRLYDKLDDWTKIHSKSENWMLDANNPYNAFDHDYSRATRTNNSKENIVYHLDELASFDATIYYHRNLQGLSFEISKDGETWESIAYRHSIPIITGGYWEKINVCPEDELPQGTSYLRIIFDNGDKKWDKNLSEIKLY